jgi:hypothetical protein
MQVNTQIKYNIVYLVKRKLLVILVGVLIKKKLLLMGLLHVRMNVLQINQLETPPMDSVELTRVPIMVT